MNPHGSDDGMQWFAGAEGINGQNSGFYEILDTVAWSHGAPGRLAFHEGPLAGQVHDVLITSVYGVCRLFYVDTAQGQAYEVHFVEQRVGTDHTFNFSEACVRDGASILVWDSTGKSECLVTPMFTPGSGPSGPAASGTLVRTTG